MASGVIRDLTSNITWKIAGNSADKTASITIPTNNYNEIIVKVKFRAYMYFNFYVAKAEIFNGDNFFDNGSSFTSSSYGCRIKINQNTVSLDTLHVSTGTEDYEMFVYYR